MYKSESWRDRHGYRWRGKSDPRPWAYDCTKQVEVSVVCLAQNRSADSHRFLSPDGRCFTYDKRANGFGRGEGAGCLVLKPLKDALEHGDHVRAVIRNSGSNQDGRTVGISLPSGHAQTELMTRDYNQAGLNPLDTHYVEAHGTGTQVGDPIEAASISKVFSSTRPSDSPLLVGSVKSNIGHLEGASGIAGVVKTILMLEKGLVLPNFDFRNSNDSIPLRDWKLEVRNIMSSMS